MSNNISSNEINSIADMMTTYDLTAEHYSDEDIARMSAECDWGDIAIIELLDEQGFSIAEDESDEIIREIRAAYRRIFSGIIATAKSRLEA